MAFHAIRAEAALEQAEYAAMLKLAALDLEQIVGESEETEAGATKLVQGSGHFRMRRHRRELFGKFLLVGVLDFDAARIRQHLHHGAADIRKRHIMPGHCEGRRIQYEVREP
jgi:hypothetical protein